MSSFHFPRKKRSIASRELATLSRELASKINHERDLEVVTDFFLEIAEDPRVCRANQAALAPDLSGLIEMALTRMAGPEVAAQVQFQPVWCEEMKLAHGPFVAGPWYGIAFCVAGSSSACITLHRVGTSRTEFFRASIVPGGLRTAGGAATAGNDARSRPS
jgi:hypothetical protein